MVKQTQHSKSIWKNVALIKLNSICTQQGGARLLVSECCVMNGNSLRQLVLTCLPRRVLSSRHSFQATNAVIELARLTV